MRATIVHIAAATVALWAQTGAARADWRDPIAGGSVIRPTRFETGERVLTVHAPPSSGVVGGESGARWSSPLVDRRLEPGQRSVPLAGHLLEAIARIEPVYDPTLLDGPDVVTPLHVSAGTAEMRDLFADHWRMTSPDPNVDLDARPLASVWTHGATPHPCAAYRVRRRHDWREAALSAPTAADCRAIRAQQSRGFADVRPIPVAIAAPSVPVFAAPDPGSRQSSEDFWAAQAARVASIHAHLHRKWAERGAGESMELRGRM